jgi:crotonobetainyl-CoA:carnitine CoA-transferase CaiB-like acyl-CoA transferase
MVEPQAALGNVRVLDLTDETGDYCTRLLAAMGADVIRVERPGGDRTRQIAPFWGDDPDPEKGLHWLHYNINKRSITLGIETEDGAALFRKLVAKSDVVVECFRPGYMDSIGIGYRDLRGIEPGIVLTSITPFGQSGPYKNFRGSHRVCAALAGITSITGEEGKPPVTPAVPMYYIMAGAAGAFASLIALRHRRRSGKGQHVDISVQESIMPDLMMGFLTWHSHQRVLQRDATFPYIPGFYRERRLFKCAGGWVAMFPTYWPGRAALRDWLAEEKLAGDLFNPKWDAVFLEGAAWPDELRYHFYEQVEQFAPRFTKAELSREGQRRGIQALPVNSVAEVVEDPHLGEKGYFATLDQPELAAQMRYHGAPARLSETPWRLNRRAPFIGEHNDEVYRGDLGLSSQRLSALKERGVI